MLGGAKQSYTNDLFSEKVLNLGPDFGPSPSPSQSQSQSNTETNSRESLGLPAKATKTPYTHPALGFVSHRQNQSLEAISPNLSPHLSGIPDFNVQALFLSESGAGQQDTDEPYGNTSAQIRSGAFQQVRGFGLDLPARRDQSPFSSQQGPRLRGAFAQNRFFGPSHHLNCVYQVLTQDFFAVTIA